MKDAPMRRRELIALVGASIVSATLWPFGARGQSGTKRIGVMVSAGENDPETRTSLTAFQRALQELGWREGGNLGIDYRYPAGDLDRMQAMAKDLLELRPDAIVAGNTPSTAALQRETKTIPIVFVNLSDPLGSGVVTSMARPGGNTTGFAAFEISLGGKWLEILKEIAPATRRVAVLFNPATATYGGAYVNAIAQAAPTFSVTASAAPVHEMADVEKVIAAQALEPGGGLLVLPDAYINNNRRQVVALTARHRLPAVYALRGMANEGGLVTYAPDTVDIYRRAAGYVDRILKGANPGELPVQFPAKYSLIVNTLTAKALGIEAPQRLLSLADEVIE
jgi:putative ABC transport system substrate-binding protein